MGTELYMKMRGTGIKIPPWVIRINKHDLDNVPCIKLYKEEQYNKNLQKINIEILRESMSRGDKFKFGELAYLIKLNNEGKFELLHKEYGDYEHVPLTNSITYNNILNQHKFKRELILIHTHPDGLGFSFRDLMVLLTNPQLRTIIAVGNNGRVYIMDVKTNNNFYGLVHMLINEVNKEKIMNRANRDMGDDKDRYYEEVVMQRFIKNISQYGIDYIISSKERTEKL